LYRFRPLANGSFNCPWLNYDCPRSALAEGGEADEEETPEDRINRIMESRKLLPNAGTVNLG